MFSEGAGRTLTAPSPVLINHELVKSSEEDLRWKVPAQFATEGTLNGDGLKEELPDAGWNVAAASLAGHRPGHTLGKRRRRRHIRD
jgi:hypothetical protein